MKKSSRISQRIKAFREYHYASQKALADALGLRQTVVSAWETGDNVPSCEAWVKLASVAPSPDNLWFLRQAGLDREIIIAAGKALGEGIVVRPRVDDMILIPRFRLTEGGREEVGAPVRLPVEFVPDPLATVCLEVNEKSTLIKRSPKGLFIIDKSVEGQDDLSALWGRDVAVQFKRDGALSSHDGLYIGKLSLQAQEGPPHGSDVVTIHAWLMEIIGHTFGEGIGMLVEAEGLRGIPLGDKFARAARVEEIRKGNLSTFRLDKGIKIVGKVTGHLTGHLKAVGDSGVEK